MIPGQTQIVCIYSHNGFLHIQDETFQRQLPEKKTTLFW